MHFLFLNAILKVQFCSIFYSFLKHSFRREAKNWEIYFCVKKEFQVSISTYILNLISIDLNLLNSSLLINFIKYVSFVKLYFFHI